MASKPTTRKRSTSTATGSDSSKPAAKAVPTPMTAAEVKAAEKAGTIVYKTKGGAAFLDRKDRRAYRKAQAK